MTLHQLQDTYQRIINYLRISVTDRCNLRCIYCMPRRGADFIPHDQILSYEEILQIARLAVQNGIRKIRLTGGEPLVRKDFLYLLQHICDIDALEQVTLTSNGVLLKDFAADIRECGVCRLNISLDTLQPDRFTRITGKNYYHQVWEGIRKAERYGFKPIKLNVVVMKGINDDEILDFARLTHVKPYHVRFIEFMPMAKNRWQPERLLSIGDIYQRIQTLGNLDPIETDLYGGPARRYRLAGAQGEIGLIGAMSHHFCSRCNRMRLTAEGALRGCLFSEDEIDIRSALRQGLEDKQIVQLLKVAVKGKPKWHGSIDSMPPSGTHRPMSGIGG